MNETSPTKTAPPDQRGGTYERDSTTRAVLWYGHDMIHVLRRDQAETTFGSASDCDIQIDGDLVSKHHGRIVRRARGTVLFDDHSKNATWIETKRTFGPGATPRFEEIRVPAGGMALRPGTTFVVGDVEHRYVAIDAAIQHHHPALLDLLGTEGELRAARDRVSPSDFLLAADSGSHLMITGHPESGPDELARVAHQVSKRRGSSYVERTQVPGDPAAQAALLRDEATKATFVLNFLALDDDAQPLDPRFVALLLSPSYQIRVIVLARSAEIASMMLGDQHVRHMLPVELRPLADRPGAIQPFLDRWFVTHGSPLRVADFTPENRARLLRHEWRGIEKLRETAKRLAAIVRAPTLNQARQALGIKRNTFYTWFGTTLRLTTPLVQPERKAALAAALGLDVQASGGDQSDEVADDLDDSETDE